MGILRVYLALCVIAAHSEGSVFPWRMHDGRQAVQIFYMISGFYMAMVLSSRYATPRDFYVSRMLRIFPPYWITLAVTVVVSVATGLAFRQWLLLTPYVADFRIHNGAAGIAFTAASNLSLIGQDWTLFLSHDAGQPLHFTSNFLADRSPLWKYLLVPQCWTVGVELTFYALAPFLNRVKSRWLAAMALCAFTARLVTYWQMGGAFDPWTYRFFPFELGLFLLGMLGYRVYVRSTPYHPSAGFKCTSKSSYLWSALLLLVCLYVELRAVGLLGRFIGRENATLASYFLWALAIPMLFFALGNQRTDRAIGELSYPIYLIHFVVVAVTTFAFTQLGFSRGIGVCSAFICIVTSIVFYRQFIAPLEAKRHTLTGTRP